MEEAAIKQAAEAKQASAALPCLLGQQMLPCYQRGESIIFLALQHGGKRLGLWHLSQIKDQAVFQNTGRDSTDYKHFSKPPKYRGRTWKTQAFTARL